MKTILILLASVLGYMPFSTTDITPEDPVQWTFKIMKLSDTEYKIEAKATIDKGWVLYSQDNGDEGPVPTSFTYSSDHGVELIGDTTEDGSIMKKMDPLFEMVVSKYKKEVTFSQKYHSDNGSISGYVTYMTCDGTRCLPPKDVEFNMAP